MMEHFETNPSSMLCLPFDLIQSRLEKLSDKQLDLFRSLRSFRRFDLSSELINNCKCLSIVVIKLAIINITNIIISVVVVIV